MTISINEQGIIEGSLVDQQFSVLGADKVNRTFTGKVSFDGLTLRELESIAFDAAKVKLRSTTLTRMNAGIETLRGKTLMFKDHQTADRGGLAAQLQAELAARDKMLEMMKDTLIKTAMTQAVQELGATAPMEDIKRRSGEIFDELYAPIKAAQK